MATPTLLVSFLSFVLFVLSLSSVAPILLLRTPPTPLGYAFLTVSSISLLSSLISRFCFKAHSALLLISSIGQLLEASALFAREKATLAMLRSPRDPHKAIVLVRVECGLMVVMFVVLVLGCVVRGCWVRECESGEDAKDEWARMRRQWMAKVQDEENFGDMRS